MRALVIGSGGREHAITWRLAQGKSVSRLYAAPGNPGIARVAECLPCSGDPEELVKLAESVDAELTIVGPEAPLVAGVVDAFRAAGRRIVGPTQAAARLEGSKIMAKNFMREAGIPTARYRTAISLEEAVAALAEFDYPVVLKADGLAAGKGVVVCEDRTRAETVLRGMFSGELVGKAGSRVVIEEFLKGEEVSFIVLTDGENVVPLQPTQDHKAAYDGDQGPNTGGMGAYCDSAILTGEQTEQILSSVIYPTLQGMKRRGTPFTGFLYAGLMMTAAGPKVLEFNVRLGDPETQVLMHRLTSDFGELLAAAAAGSLAGAEAAWYTEPSVCVVMAAHGYPGKVRTGDLIEGIDEAEATGAVVFQAGTRVGPKGLETAGGRVLAVTATGQGLSGAIENAYRGVERIRFDGVHYRKDIGRKGLRRYNKEGSGT